MTNAWTAQAFLVLLALLGPVATQPTDYTDSGANSGPTTKSYCLRPTDSQNEFEVVIVLPNEDYEDRREYYAEFGKEMVPGGSMVLYKGRMGLLNSDCSVTAMEFGFPISYVKARGVLIPLTIVMAVSFLLMEH